MSGVRSILGAAAFAFVCAASPAARADGSCGDQVHHNDCGSGNIYPCCDNGGNCTWWAWESVCRNWHIAMVNWGNANTWAAHAHTDPNFDVLGQPVVGSIATRDLGAFGHVAWVTAVNGSNVTVTEENCCSTCSPGLRTHTYPAGYFNSGYVVRHGTCQCSPGEQQNQGCGDCGGQQRTCGGDCNWGDWSACNGPDPGGGNTVCETGVPGPCADGRIRCVGGNTTCKSLVDPSPEVCDGVDNDCNGQVDDGHPPMGATVPDYAAQLVDVSYPEALRAGEHATLWAEFRNVGVKPWADDGIWLAALGGNGGAVGEASALFMADHWPAWNVATVLDHTVMPGEIGRFAFDVVAPAEAQEITEIFRLQSSEGTWITCPESEIVPSIRILPAIAHGGGGAGGAPSGPVATGDQAGCSHTPIQGNGAGAAWGMMISLAMLALSRARRRG